MSYEDDDDEEINLVFSDLINEDFPEMLFHYLTMKDLLKLRVTSREMKDTVDLYIKKKPSILRLPTGIRYNRPTIATIAQNIYKACDVFNKQPQECTMSLECNIFHNKIKTMIESDPPLAALAQIGTTGVKISLRLFFNVGRQETYQETWQSYIQTLADVILRLPSITNLDIDFSFRQIPRIHGTWFDRTAIIIGGLQYLSSLSISGQAPWERIFNSCRNLQSLTQLERLEVHEDVGYFRGEELVEFMNQMINLRELSIHNFRDLPAEELITCLSSMPELTSFTVNDSTIINSDSVAFGEELCTALRNLSFLRLSNSWIEHENICAIIPNIIPLLQNLETLDISNSSIDFNFFMDIADGLEGNMPNLISLNLSYNSIGEKPDDTDPFCIMALLTTLGLLHNLVELNISSNDIDSAGVDLLIPVLQSLPSLSFLDMSGNKLNQSSINLLIRSFRRFKQLDTSGNEPDDEESDEYGDQPQLNLLMDEID